MYTFAHPIEDAIERITHSICTLEFEDQRPFYDWLLERIVPVLRAPQFRAARELLAEIHAEGVEARPGAGQGVLEPPEAGEVDLFRKAQHEADDGFDIAVLLVMDPEGAALGRVLAHQVEARDLRVVGVLIRGAEFLEQRDRTGGLSGLPTSIRHEKWVK
jgi:hypothetical protein